MIGGSNHPSLPAHWYLDVDARNVPLNNNNRYQISGLPNVGYEAGNRDRSAFSKALGLEKSQPNA